jgi:hypothetical protein
MKDTDNVALGIVVIALFIGGIILLTRRSHSSQSQPQELGNVHYSQIIERQGDEPKGAKHYTNTKEWNITYNEDGMPTKIVKHVHAVVA